MRIIAVVGIQESGKTNTIIALTEAIRRRGKRVGICKTITSPTFTIGGALSDAMRCRRAGSEIVCTRAKGETAFLYPEAFSLSKVLESYRDCDYVLLEGDYFAPVPRIVCAQHEKDALIRLNTRTLAFAGCISEKAGLTLPLPCFNALSEADSLLDYIDKMIPNILPCTLLDELLPPVAGIIDDGFQCKCQSPENRVENNSLQVIFNGESVKLSESQRNMLLNWIRENKDH